MKQLLLDIQPPPAPSFDNFIAGRNTEAVHSLQNLLSQTGAVNFIYVWGTEGCGKSHLLKACENQAALMGMALSVVDNVHLLDPEQQIMLFNHFNEVRASGGRLVTSGNAAPMQMGLRDDLATRLAWGLVYQLHSLSDQEKALALQHHAQARGMKLPAEVVEYCLRHLRRDLPTLMSVLDALDQWSLREKKPVTLPMLKKLLQLNLQY